MQVRVQLVDDAYHFAATNETGNRIDMDASPASGGKGEAPRPMEVLAMSMGGCSSIDVLSILRKQRQVITRFEVQVGGQRAQDQVPAVFTDLHLHFVLEGELAPEKVRRAIELSLSTYCSVSRMLEKTVTITYSYSVNGEEYGR